MKSTVAEELNEVRRLAELYQQKRAALENQILKLTSERRSLLEAAEKTWCANPRIEKWSE